MFKRHSRKHVFGSYSGYAQVESGKNRWRRTNRCISITLFAVFTQRLTFFYEFKMFMHFNDSMATDGCMPVLNPKRLSSKPEFGTAGNKPGSLGIKANVGELFYYLMCDRSYSHRKMRSKPEIQHEKAMIELSSCLKCCLLSWARVLNIRRHCSTALWTLDFSSALAEMKRCTENHFC